MPVLEGGEFVVSVRMDVMDEMEEGGMTPPRLAGRLVGEDGGV